MDAPHSNREWDRHEILAEVRRRGSTLAKIGKAVGLKPPSMTWALFSKPHAKANKAIADFLGVPMHELWPNWYDEDGKVISTRPIQKRPRDLTARRFQPSRPRNLVA